MVHCARVISPVGDLLVVLKVPHLGLYVDDLFMILLSVRRFYEFDIGIFSPGWFMPYSSRGLMFCIPE